MIRLFDKYDVSRLEHANEIVKNMIKNKNKTKIKIKIKNKK